MSKINTARLLSFALASMFLMNSVAFASEPQDIINADQLTPQQINYQTTEVTRGSLITEAYGTANQYYPLNYSIQFDQNNAKFVEFTVDRGIAVKAGDVLARFEVTGSDAELTRMKLNLQRTEEQTEEGIRDREQALAKKREELNTAIAKAETAENAVVIAEEKVAAIAEATAAETTQEITSETVTETTEETAGETVEETTEKTKNTAEEAAKDVADKKLAAKTAQYEVTILKLSIERMESELEQYKYRQQYNIEQHRKTYNDEQARLANNVLISPVDGIVSEVNYKRAGDTVSPNEILLVISSSDIMLLAFENESGELRYNMPVEIRIGNSKNPTILSGRIVAADDAIPEKERTGYALVQLDEGEDAGLVQNGVKIVGQTIRLDDIPLVPKNAVTKESDKYFVTKLNDSMVQKRYIASGISNTESMWVLNGAEEGETLILD